MQGRAINNIFIKSSGNRVAFRKGAGERVSWSQYIDDIARFAKYFSDIDVDTVILYIPDDFYLFCVCFMGLICAGRAVVLPAMLSKRNVGDMTDLTNVVVTNINDELPGVRIVRPVAPDNAAQWGGADISDGVVWFFTSGSTGVPKRIKKTMSMLLAEVEYHVSSHSDAIAQSPVLVASIAPHHMYGLLWRVLFPMVGKIAVDIDAVFTPEELQQKQTVYDKILFVTTPSFLDGITRYENQYKFAANCIGIFTSGSLLSKKTSQLTCRIFNVSPVEIFGSTETGGVAFRQQINGENWTVFDTVNVSVNNDNRLVINSQYSFENPYVMSDAVRLNSDGTFILLGRADRVVKIAEERINLLEMEHAIMAHECVECAHCVAMRVGERDVIGVVVVPTDLGRDMIVSTGRRVFIDVVKNMLRGVIPPVAWPRRIRIVNKIPTNPQGKFVRDDIMAMLNSSVAEPVMQNMIMYDNKLSANLTFLGDSMYFVGHFPGYPILPGVIQLHFVFRFIGLFFNIDVAEFDVVRLKFSSLMLPGHTYGFKLERVDENIFSFAYTDGGCGCSSGQIKIKRRKN